MSRPWLALGQHQPLGDPTSRPHTSTFGAGFQGSKGSWICSLTSAEKLKRRLWLRRLDRNARPDRDGRSSSLKLSGPLGIPSDPYARGGSGVLRRANVPWKQGTNGFSFAQGGEEAAA